MFKKNDRNKALALDEKVSKKLNNIINRIHDPITVKNSHKEAIEFSSKNQKDDQKTTTNHDLNVLASTTSINSCLFNKNLGSSANHKGHHPLSQENQ